MGLSNTPVHNLILPALKEMRKRRSHFSSNVSGANRINSNTVFVQFGGDRGHHCANSALGCAVRRGSLRADGHIGSNTSYQDDAPTFRTIRDHGFCRELGAEVDTLAVNANQLVEVSFRRVEKLYVLVYPSASNEDIKLAIEVSCYRGECSL